MNPIKRSVTIRGHRTSVSLEEVFWAELREEARERGLTLAALIDDIDRIWWRKAFPHGYRVRCASMLCAA
jgi:Uncharacterized protein related to arylsulfate sulfotransferase involved in siderophore biosynthesis